MVRKQQLINLLSNFANLFTNILLGLFFTPYLVKTLGIAAYGVLPLAIWRSSAGFVNKFIYKCHHRCINWFNEQVLFYRTGS